MSFFIYFLLILYHSVQHSHNSTALLNMIRHDNENNTHQKSPITAPPAITLSTTKIDQKTSEELLQKRTQELELVMQNEAKQAAEAIEARKKKEEEDKKSAQEYEDFMDRLSGRKKLQPINLSIFSAPTSKTGLGHSLAFQKKLEAITLCLKKNDLAMMKPVNA